MENTGIKLNEKYSVEQKMENINKFISNNSNEKGIDLKKLYFGKLIYHKDDKIDLEEQELANKITIVYIAEDWGIEKIYMDLFNKRLLQSTTHIIPGILSFAPFIRMGLSITILSKLSDSLNAERLSFEELNCLYNKISEIDCYKFLGMSLDELNTFYESNIKK